MTKPAETTEYYPVPQSAEKRACLRDLAERFALENKLVPPLSLREVRAHARQLAEQCGEPEFQDFLAVLLGNAVWFESFAAVPFERRLLLLPRCLRSSAKCRAEEDEFGLLCDECGECKLGTLQEQAEALGYTVLIAEGTTMASRLLRGGLVDAVLGVSCLDSLERSLPRLNAEAIPGLAVPLLRNGCVDTEVDLDWALEVLRQRSETGGVSLVDTEALRAEVNRRFDPGMLKKDLNLGGTETEALAISWLASGGKRWRPFLTLAVWRALRGGEEPVPEALWQVAVAIECFHKASLAHDDIEDGDEKRYGEPTLHCREGVPLALNTGDLLIGEGYRLLAELDLCAEIRGELLRIAARGHRELSVGQGEELLWMREPRSLLVAEVLSVHRRKTASAFNVAVQMGAVCAGADDEVRNVLAAFSRALGVAFQIRDDLDDGAKSRTASPELSILSACAHEEPAENPVEGAKQLLESLRLEAIDALSPLKNVALKCLLRKIAARLPGPL